MNRRSFLKNTATVASAPLFVNGLAVQPFGQNFFTTLNEDDDRVLVLIQLNGGNDGLSTILPLDQYSNLAAVRSNVLIPENQALHLEDGVGLHPVLTGLKGLYDDAKMTIVQSVGYPDQNRSHFRSTDIWETGSPADEFYATGWLGRWLQSDHPTFPDDYPQPDFPAPFAISMGRSVSQTCQGELSNFSIALVDPFNLSQVPIGEQGSTPDTPYGMELSWLRQMFEQTNQYSSVIEGAANAGNSMAAYPNFGLAEQLQTVARLISGGLQSRVYIVSLGGFDTHAAQVVAGDPTTGEHATLLDQLSQSVAAFQEDLKLLGLEDRVLGMTYSEFGRRIQSNLSNGTDHGSAAPMLLFGTCVNPGIIGDNPQIPEVVDIQEGVAMQFDFRDVYGSVLMDWFGVEQSEVQSLLHQQFTYLPILEPCDATVVSNRNPQDFYTTIYTEIHPNPVQNSATIALEVPISGRVRIQLFDTTGALLLTLTDRRLPAGKHQIPVRTTGLAAGSYFYRVQLESGAVASRGFVKI